MRLRYTTTSPFVRKVTASAIELGLAERIERVPTEAANPAHRLADDNPLNKVPALRLDDGTTLYDSPVICEYLDDLAGGHRLFPAPGPARWTALRLMALGDGIVDAAVLAMYERRVRPEALRWPDWRERQEAKVRQGIAALAADLETLRGPLTIGTLTAAIVLDYIDFRFPDWGWRDGHGDLGDWLAGMLERPSLAETRPKAS